MTQYNSDVLYASKENPGTTHKLCLANEITVFRLRTNHILHAFSAFVYDQRMSSDSSVQVYLPSLNGAYINRIG